MGKGLSGTVESNTSIQELKQLHDEIERVRLVLNRLGSQFDLRHSDVIRQSRELDRLIIRSYRKNRGASVQ